ncbi:uncharacterized protein DUF2569 [Mesorhizobium loti]|uniref:Uncharacterized protein DUF2569 n=1 Tax=Rhizobium loti TaxID=381 RepID=A0A8E2W658_RHILI|nr:hypothetical protein [Mesorhizobium loti]PWJ87035.1 uncharacterized protein DUF2569 [Mesorhizobium loti]
MGAFSIWHWAIVLLLIGVPVFFAVRSAAKPSRNPEALVGFGGWLMLLAIGQTLSPLRTLADFANSADGYQQLMTLSNGPLAVYGEVALNLAFLALSWLCSFRCCGEATAFRNCFCSSGSPSLSCLSWTRSGFHQFWGSR